MFDDRVCVAGRPVLRRGRGGVARRGGRPAHGRATLAPWPTSTESSNRIHKLRTNRAQFHRAYNDFHRYERVALFFAA